jgi:hypothetical protein
VTDHITGVLEKLTMKERYYGGDQVHTASGAGIEIKHIGRCIVHTPNQDLLLNNVLYVPQAKKNLASIHKLHMIITLSLNSILGIFSLRTEQRESFCGADVRAAFTL